jgi:GTP-binding protein Era
MTEKLNTFVTTVAFVGQPNVGKSTLLNSLVGTKIAPTTRKAQTTRRIIRGIKTLANYQHIYFDTPGAVRKETGLDLFMHDQIFQALSNVEQVVAITDAKDSLRRHLDFLKRIKNSAQENNQVFILVINKIDELKNKNILLDLINQYTQALGNITIIPVSAIKKDGLDILFDTLNQKARLSEFIFSPDFFTDASEKEIVAELIREKALLELRDEVPYKLAVTVDHFDEQRREDSQKPLINIEAILHVERKSQKAIVVGKGGLAIKTIGIRARKDIEHLLQCHVMLKLFVRVEPNWTTSSKALRKLGY